MCAADGRASRLWRVPKRCYPGGPRRPGEFMRALFALLLALALPATAWAEAGECAAPEQPE